MDNEERADLGADAIYAAGMRTGVTECEPVSRVIADVLAYVGLCDRVGIDPQGTSSRASTPYRGDFEDGPRATRLEGFDGDVCQWGQLDSPEENDEREGSPRREVLMDLRDNWLADYTAAIREHGSDDAKHDLLVEIAKSVRRGLDTAVQCEPLAVLAFQPEALDSAAQFFRCLAANGPRVGGWADRSGQGYTVDATTKDGRRFTAEVRDVTVGDDGQYNLVLAEWDENAGRGDRRKLVALDIYDEAAERIEVV